MSDQKQPPQHQDKQPGDEYAMRPEPEYIRDSYRGTDKLLDKIAIITGGAGLCPRRGGLHDCLSGRR